MDVKTVYKNGLPAETVVLYSYADALEIVEQECGAELARYLEKELRSEDKTEDLKKDIEALEYENRAYTDDIYDLQEDLRNVANEIEGLYQYIIDSKRINRSKLLETLVSIKTDLTEWCQKCQYLHKVLFLVQRHCMRYGYLKKPTNKKKPLTIAAVEAECNGPNQKQVKAICYKKIITYGL